MSELFAYCKVSISPVRAEAKDAAEMVTQLLFGEVVTILERTDKWFKVQSYSDNYIGWIDPKQIQSLSKKETNRWLDGLSFQRELQTILETPWGNQTIHKGSFVPFSNEESFNIGNDQFKPLHISEFFDTQNPYEIATEYLNTPYLWGGKTPYGIDCSGLTQMVFRFLDINLPRDAYQQAEYGTEVDFEDLQSGDVAFFHNDNQRIIHVGVADGQGKIIHASGQVRIDQLNSKGIYREDTNEQTHQLNCIKRMC